MNSSDRPSGLTWLSSNWYKAGLIAALFLLALVPLLIGAWNWPLILIYLHLPAYMIHQVEEHAGDRFRSFVNQHIGHGKDVLTTRAVLVVNIPGVWGTLLVTLYLARFVDPFLGLIAPYFVLINALVHIAASLRLRLYNPGLWTSLGIFLPLGALTLYVISPAPLVYHLAATAIVITLHAAIIVKVRSRLKAV